MNRRARFIWAAIAASLCLCLSIGIVTACTDGGEGGESKGTRYSIQAPDASEVFTVSDLPDGAYEGDTVTFGITLTHPDESTLEGVELYGSQTGYERLTAGTDGKYSFTMPAEPVRLTVDAAYYPDNETDNFLSWDEENPASAEKWQAAFEGDAYYASSDDVLLTANVTDDPDNTGGWFNNHDERAFSLNEDVIPNDALQVTYDEQGDRNDAYRFIVHIDRSKISAGTAKIVLIVENESSFDDESILACTMTVTEPEPLKQVEIWTTTIVFDLTNIINDENTENLYFAFTDLDWDETMYAQQYQTILDGDYEIASDNTVTITLNYAVGHSYSVELAYRMSDPPSAPSIAVGETENAQYSNGELTFTANGGSIEFIVG